MKKNPIEVNPYLIDQLESNQFKDLELALGYSTEWDEFWSYVACKTNQSWTWYSIEQQSRVILAWQNGRRTNEVFQKLLDKVAHLPIRRCHTDD